MIAMILILLMLLVAAGVALFLLLYAEHIHSEFVRLIGFSSLCIVVVCSAAYARNAWDWFACEYKANIINREYGTNYSREEVFFASDVIDTIRELDRKRIEVNGDLMTGKERAK